MSSFRRRRTEGEAAASPPQTRHAAEAGHAPPHPRPAEVRLPANVERALIALTTKMQQCIDRLDALEHRIDELAETAVNSPSHSDVLEVRLHSAKLAAELARATVELRGEIGMASEEARRAARISRSETSEAQATDQEIDLTSTINLTSENDEAPKDGWSASA